MYKILLPFLFCFFGGGLVYGSPDLRMVSGGGMTAVETIRANHETIWKMLSRPKDKNTVCPKSSDPFYVVTYHIK